jgi:hypothetical protein
MDLQAHLPSMFFAGRVTQNRSSQPIEIILVVRVHHLVLNSNHFDWWRE